MYLSTVFLRVAQSMKIHTCVLLSIFISFVPSLLSPCFADALPYTQPKNGVDVFLLVMNCSAWLSPMVIRKGQE